MTGFGAITPSGGPEIAAPEPAERPTAGGFSDLLEAHSRAARAPSGERAAPSRTESEAHSAPPATDLTSRLDGPEELSPGARAPRDALTEENMAGTEPAETAPAQPSDAVEEPADEAPDPESEASSPVAEAPEGEAAAEGEAPAVALPAVAADAESGDAEVDVARAEAKARAVETKAAGDRPVQEAAADAEAAEPEAEAEAEAEAPSLDVDVEAPAPAARAEATVALSDGARAAYDAAARGMRPGGTEVARAGTWDAELVEQLRSQQSLRRLDDGRLRVQLTEGGERVTLTLTERDGAVHLRALTASRAMADAMTERVEELRAALADIGMSLGDLEAQTEAEGGAPDDAEDAEGEAPGPARPTPPPLYVTRHRIIA